MKDQESSCIKTHHKFGVALIRFGCYRNAITKFKQFASLDPEYERDYKFHISLCYYLLEEYEKAKKYIQNF